VGPVAAGDGATLLAVARRIAVPLGIDPARRAVGLPVPVAVLEPAGADLAPRDAAGSDGVDRLRHLIQTSLVDAGLTALPLLVTDAGAVEDMRRAVGSTHPRLTVVPTDALPPGEPLVVIRTLGWSAAEDPSALAAHV
jgi:hypothetical protein